MEAEKFKELSVEEMYEILRVRDQVFIVEQECSYQDIDSKDKMHIIYLHMIMV